MIRDQALARTLFVQLRTGEYIRVLARALLLLLRFPFPRVISKLSTLTGNNSASKQLSFLRGAESWRVALPLCASPRDKLPFVSRRRLCSHKGAGRTKIKVLTSNDVSPVGFSLSLDKTLTDEREREFRWLVPSLTSGPDVNSS